MLVNIAFKKENVKKMHAAFHFKMAIKDESYLCPSRIKISS